MIGRSETFLVSTFKVGESKQAAEILSKAYQKIGHTITVKNYPGKRSVYYANEGISDAELIRIKGTEVKYPNLVRIPTPILISKMVVLTSKDSNFTPLKWEDLAKTKIGIPLGVKLLEDRIAHLAPMRVPYSENLLRMVILGRIEVAAMPLAMALQHTELVNQLRIVEPSIEDVELYHFVHKKHKKLIKELSSAIKELNEINSIN